MENNMENNNENRNLEVILKIGNEKDDNEINWGEEFAKIFHRLRSKRHYFIRITAIFMIAGFIVGLILPFVGSSSKTAEASITFAYEGIESGLAPDGTPFDITKIKSPAIIEDALNASAITDISAEKIRNNIIINGVVPSDIINQVNVINTISEKNPEALKEILDINYNPSQFIVSLEFGNMGISSQKACQILNAVLESYREYFHSVYYNENLLSASVNIFDYSTYDYAEALSIMETQIKTMDNYITFMISETDDFRSPSLSLKYSDIQQGLNIVNDIDIAKLYSIVYSNNLTMNKDNLITYYSYLIEQAQRELNEALENRNTIQNSLNSYQKNPVIIAGKEEQEQLSELNLSGEMYDELIEKYIKASEKVSNINTNIAKYNDRINNIKQYALSAVNIPEQEYAALTKSASESISAINEKLNGYISDINTITKEYYENKKYNDAYKITTPASYKAGTIFGMAVSGVKYAVVGGIAGFVIMLIYQTAAVYIPFDIFFEKNKNNAGNKNKKENK